MPYVKAFLPLIVFTCLGLALFPAQADAQEETEASMADDPAEVAKEVTLEPLNVQATKREEDIQ